MAKVTEHKNGIVFHRNANFVVARNGKLFEVVTLKGSDGGPEMVSQFATPEEAIEQANKLANDKQL